MIFLSAHGTKPRKPSQISTEYTEAAEFCDAGGIHKNTLKSDYFECAGRGRKIKMLLGDWQQAGAERGQALHEEERDVGGVMDILSTVGGKARIFFSMGMVVCRGDVVDTSTDGVT